MAKQSIGGRWRGQNGHKGSDAHYDKKSENPEKRIGLRAVKSGQTVDQTTIIRDYKSSRSK